jgi:hypothetical protein
MEMNDNTTRRMFLSQGMAAIAALYLPWDLLKAENFKDTDIFAKGILFSKDEIPRIKKNTQNKDFKEYYNSILNADLKADEKFIKEEVNYHRKFRDLIKLTRIIKRSSFIYLLENKQEHADIAKMAIDKTLSFEQWDYFLEGGKDYITFQCAPETIFNLAFGIDWLGDKLSSKDKEDIFKAIAEKGAKPCYTSLYGMRYPDKVKGWTFDKTEDIPFTADTSKWPIIINRTNLKMIPITGILYASLILKGKHPDTEKWMEMGLWSLKDFSTMWEKDGCYSEGFGYSAYSSKHLMMAADILNRNTKTKYNDVINFKGYARYILRMMAPFKDFPGGSINFGDNAFSLDSGFLCWVGREFKDGIAQYTAEQAQSNQSIQDVINIIWFDDNVKPQKPGLDLTEVKFMNDWVVSRTGFGETDTVVGFRSGGPANHEHADRNSIVLNGCGDRFFHDPLGAAYYNTDKHWLLRQTEAHTAILIDGKGHQYHKGEEGTNASKAKAKVVQYKPGKKVTIVTSDATPAYKLVNEDIDKVQRTFVLIKPDILVIIDEMKKIKDNSKIQAHYQAFNKDNKAVVKPESDHFEIQRPHARLFAKAGGNVKFTYTKGELDIPQNIGVFPYIEVSGEPAKDCVMITACAMMPIECKDEPVIDITSKSNEYKIKVKSQGKETNLSVKINKTVPEIKLA